MVSSFSSDHIQYVKKSFQLVLQNVPRIQPLDHRQPSNRFAHVLSCCPQVCSRLGQWNNSLKPKPKTSQDLPKAALLTWAKPKAISSGLRHPSDLPVNSVGSCAWLGGNAWGPRSRPSLPGKQGNYGGCFSQTLDISLTREGRSPGTSPEGDGLRFREMLVNEGDLLFCRHSALRASSLGLWLSAVQRVSTSHVSPVRTVAQEEEGERGSGSPARPGHHSAATSEDEWPRPRLAVCGISCLEHPRHSKLSPPGAQPE